jgi:hypothetical protein
VLSGKSPQRRFEVITTISSFSLASPLASLIILPYDIAVVDALSKSLFGSQ